MIDFLLYVFLLVFLFRYAITYTQPPHHTDVAKDLYNYFNPRTQLYCPMISKETYDVIIANGDRLNSAIIYDRDFGYNYFGFRVCGSASIFVLFFFLFFLLFILFLTPLLFFHFFYFPFFLFLLLPPSLPPPPPPPPFPQTLERSYLLKINGKIAERPQHMLMRVAVGIHGNNIDAVIEVPIDNLSNPSTFHFCCHHIHM